MTQTLLGLTRDQHQTSEPMSGRRRLDSVHALSRMDTGEIRKGVHLMRYAVLLLAGVGLAVVLVSTTFPAFASTFFTIDVPEANCEHCFTQILGINNVGDIVGAYTAGEAIPGTCCPLVRVHGFVLHRGQFTKIDAP